MMECQSLFVAMADTTDEGQDLWAILKISIMSSLGRMGLDVLTTRLAVGGEIIANPWMSVMKAQGVYKWNLHQTLQELWAW
jgi:hypothetical protein